METRGSAEGRDLTIQGAILRRLLHSPPVGLRLEELEERILGPNPTPAMAARFERAADVLREFGLVLKEGEHYKPSRAAVHYRKLLVR